MVFAKKHDEPPTDQGAKLHRLIFRLNQDSMVLVEHRRSKRKVKIPLISISKELVDSLENRLNVPNNVFMIRREINGEKLRTIELDLDSLSICRSYERSRVNSTGGFEIKVIGRSKRNEIFKFEFERPEDLGNFDFLNYLVIYPLLENNLPSAVPGSHIFDDLFLLKVVEEYYNQIQCEDYYYQQFLKEHPERTKQENRMRKGWDFKTYLKGM